MSEDLKPADLTDAMRDHIATLRQMRDAVMKIANTLEGEINQTQALQARVNSSVRQIEMMQAEAKSRLKVL